MLPGRTRTLCRLYRLPPSRRVLRFVEPLIHSRPDLSPVLAHFLSGFPNDLRVALLLHKVLAADPVFDAAAGNFVLSLDKCAPTPEPRKFRRGVSKLMGRSEEKSILLDVPAKLYSYKRMSTLTAVTAIQSERNPLVAGQLIHYLLSDPRYASLSYLDLRPALSKFANSSPDEDLSRFCTYLMLAGLRRIPRSPRPAGSLILKHLGYVTPPAGASFLRGFFRDLFAIPALLDWERLLGRRAHGELQRRAIVIRGGWAGNPSVFVTVLDSFNDLLVQRFSRKHVALRTAFVLAAGRRARVPDFGNWIKNPTLIATLPKASPIFLECHRLRVRAEISHATDKKTGRFTRPVSYREKDKITKKLKSAYTELLTEWAKI